MEGSCIGDTRHDTYLQADDKAKTNPNQYEVVDVSEWGSVDPSSQSWCVPVTEVLGTIHMQGLIS